MNNIESIPANIYYALPNYSQSSLKYYLTHTPARAKQLKEEGVKDSPALLEGRLKHLVLLEFSDFIKTVHALQEGETLRTKANREKKEQLEKEGKHLLPFDKYHALIKFRADVLRHKEAEELLKGCEFERSIIWSFEGLELKSRLDGLKWVSSDTVDIIDLKNFTSQGRPLNNQNIDTFLMYYAKKYALDFQAGAYIKAVESCGVKVRNYTVLFVESESNLPIIRTLSPRMIEGGKKAFETAAQLCIHAENIKSFPAFSQGSELDFTDSIHLEIENNLENLNSLLI